MGAPARVSRIYVAIPVHAAEGCRESAASAPLSIARPYACGDARADAWVSEERSLEAAASRTALHQLVPFHCGESSLWRAPRALSTPRTPLARSRATKGPPTTESLAAGPTRPTMPNQILSVRTGGFLTRLVRSPKAHTGLVMVFGDHQTCSKLAAKTRV